jgi:hypothetical protein
LQIPSNIYPLTVSRFAFFHFRVAANRLLVHYSESTVNLLRG